MDYLKLYKKRVSTNGSTISESRLNETKNDVARNIKNIQGYHPAIHYDKECFNDKIDGKKLDIVVRSGASELEKTIMFGENDSVMVGSYIEYKNKIFIVREINDDLSMTTTKAFRCNQIITLKGFGNIPCYANSSTYGSKGIINQDKFYELDSKTKVYVQKNNVTDDMKIGMRIMFANKYVYRITEFDDTVYPNMYTIVCSRDENNVMDDFENNIAWNDEYLEDGNVDSEIVIDGIDSIKIGQTQVYTSNTPVTWSVDDLDSVVIVEQNDTSITLKGVQQNWIVLSATNETETKTLDIMIYR